jgi:hypothetical protein
MDLPRHSSDEQSGAHEAALKRRLHQLIDAASMLQFFWEDNLSRVPALQTAFAGVLPQLEDVLRLILRRRVPLPDVAPNGGPQPVIIGGEARRLSPASIDALRWLFDRDPATWRALRDSIEAVHELLRFGFLVVNRVP